MQTPPQEWWERVARNEVRIKQLEEYQDKQNGRLQRIEDKLDAFQNWLYGIMGMLIVSLILLVINLATH